MADWPSVSDLVTALKGAATAHHDYETNHLGGARDEHWAGWYAAYVLGRLGDFIGPTALTEMLIESPNERDWVRAAAEHVRKSAPTGS